MTPNTLSQAVLANTNLKTFEKDLLLIVGGSLFIGLMAQLSFYLPFTVVPVTMQSFAVLLIGASFGSKRAFLTTTLYLLEGILGLPVFAGLGFGIAKLFGPSGGYLIGFIAAATLMGFLSEKLNWDKTFLKSLFLFSIGHGVIFLFGLAGLTKFFSGSEVFAMGLIPFIPGMIIKTCMAFPLLPKAWTLVRK